MGVLTEREHVYCKLLEETIEVLQRALKEICKECSADPNLGYHEWIIQRCEQVGCKVVTDESP